MLSGISHYHPQWPVGSGGCSASEYIGLVPPQKHVLGIWPQRLGGGHAVSAGCPTGPQSVYADMLFLSVNRRVLSLPFLELGQSLLAAPGLSTHYSWPHLGGIDGARKFPWPLGIRGTEISIYPCYG